MHMTSPSEQSYGLVTAAYNEIDHIEKTLKSVVSQTELPRRWVIVSDGSTDGTDDVIREYAMKWNFIAFVRRETQNAHNFASKVQALNLALGHLLRVPVDFVGNLDADVSFEPTYFRELLGKFESNPALGIAGGVICEWDGDGYMPRDGNREDAVAGAVQMFRRECHATIGAFRPLLHGGEDWCAEIVARMHGWDVKSFSDLRIKHHRPTGTASGILRNCIRQGLMDYSLGSGLVFEVFRVCRRVPTRPLAIGALARLLGYLWGCCFGRPEVPEAVAAFLRQTEAARLKLFLRNPFRDPSVRRTDLAPRA